MILARAILLSVLAPLATASICRPLLGQQSPPTVLNAAPQQAPDQSAADHPAEKTDDIDSQAANGIDRQAAAAAPATQPAAQFVSDERRLIGGSTGGGGSGGDSGGWLGPTWWALGLVIVVIFAAAYVLKRMNFSGGVRPGGVFRVLGRWHIASRQYVTLVQVGRRMLLLGMTNQNISMLSEICDPGEIEHLLANCPANRSILADGFSQLLGRQGEELAEEDHATTSASAGSAVGQLSSLIGRLKTKLGGHRRQDGE